MTSRSTPTPPAPAAIVAAGLFLHLYLSPLPSGFPRTRGRWKGRLRANFEMLPSAIEPLPRVCVRRLATGARENLVEPLHRLRRKPNLRHLQHARELLHRARADDRRGDDWVVQQPSQRDIRRRLA